jgi:hypothetical protein
MASFRGSNFKEGAEGAGTFPVWHRKARSAILDLPGANEDMLATVSGSELAALYGDIGQSGSLVYHLGTYTAYLDDIDGHEIVDADLYAINLSFIRQ